MVFIKRFLALLLVTIGQGVAYAEQEDVSGLVDTQQIVTRLEVQLAYASADNFMGQNVYGDQKKCWLQSQAADMLLRADEALHKLNSDLRLLALDCARPTSVQFKMWDVVKGTPQSQYVANPHSAVGSIHNYGCAIDITLTDSKRGPLDMGTPYDYFGHAAQPRKEFDLLRQQRLSPRHIFNRLMLRAVMIEAGFLPISNEWWHFNCLPAKQAKRRFSKISKFPASE